MPEIRRAERRDLPAIADIQAASPEAVRWPVEDYLRYDLRVATLAGRVAGFLACRPIPEGESEILNLAVEPGARRQGLARALVRSLLAERPRAVYLEVRASNQGAVELYKSLGFQEFMVRPGYYDSPAESAVVMKFHSC